MKNNLTIAIDAMGGDNSPYKSLKGVDIFLKNNTNIKIVLLGNKFLIEKTINDIFNKNKIKYLEKKSLSAAFPEATLNICNEINKLII